MKFDDIRYLGLERLHGQTFTSLAPRLDVDVAELIS
jgi:hypothetical protein